MNLLLLSNSTNFGDPYLHHAAPVISDFLKHVKSVLFIPYAGVTISYDNYEDKVRSSLKKSHLNLTSIHHFENPLNAIMEAEAIAVGGGNTFQLLAKLQKLNLVETLRQRVLLGLPYVGWSAGSNIAGPTICTTNDMPVVEPESFNALNLVPFQINPHFTEAVIPDHGGESRTDRLKEYLQINQNQNVVCMPEGTWLQIRNGICTSGGVPQVLALSYGSGLGIFDASAYQPYLQHK